jgi:uncharacterized protein
MKLVRFSIAAILILQLGVIVHAASFNCARASTSTEKAICSDKELSTFDDQVSALYKAGLARETVDAAEQLRISQRAWLKTRNACLDVSCLQQTYRGRLAFLSFLSKGPIPQSVADTGSTAALASSAPASAETASSGDQSDLCEAIALARVPASGVDDPESALAPGEIDHSVTQYQIDKKTGVGSFCSHGGYCYPRFKLEAGKPVEVLHLQNCRVGGKIDEDDDDTTYSVDLDRSKNSQADLKWSDVQNTLVGMNLEEAEADEAAQYYVQKPTSRCGMLVKKALEGDPVSKSKLQEFPDYCQQR